jgi:hypothetical protein
MDAYTGDETDQDYIDFETERDEAAALTTGL